MHPVAPWSHSSKARKPRGTKCSARSSSQRCCAEKSQTAPTPDGSQFCRCRQQPSLQTRTLAATLATANPRLLDRGDPKHAHPAGASKSKAQRRCSGGAAGICNKIAVAPLLCVTHPSFALALTSPPLQTLPKEPTL